MNAIFNLLEKILIGFHEVVTLYSSENKKLKELNFQLREEYNRIDKNFLENKLKGYEIKSKNIIKEYRINMKEFDFKNNEDVQYNKIKKINEKNIDDLDALYFFDKIETKPQRSFSGGELIPLLPLNYKK